MNFDHKSINEETNSSSGKEILFKMIPSNDFLFYNEDVSNPLQKASISSPIAPKLNNSVDMFDDSITQKKNIDEELEHRSTDVHLSSKIKENIKFSDEIIDKNFIKNKNKITYYFPIKKNRFPKLTEQEDEFFNINANSISTNYCSAIKLKKLKSNCSKINVGTIDKYLYNNVPEKIHINPDGNESKKIIKVNNPQNKSCVIDFSNFPKGSFKTIKEFPKPITLAPFNNIVNDFQIKNKSNINNISKNAELGCFPGKSTEKNQTPFINRCEVCTIFACLFCVLFIL